VKSTDELAIAYHETIYTEARAEIARTLLERAPDDATAVEMLLVVLNDLDDPELRLAIVEQLGATRPAFAVRALTKAMFDPAPLVRARAALAVAAYDDRDLLAPWLSVVLDAVPDPATREPAERVVRLVTGKGPEKITVSERERLRAGDPPRSIWREHFAASEPPAQDETSVRDELPPPSDEPPPPPEEAEG
jgi:hypothetical protein